MYCIVIVLVTQIQEMDVNVLSNKMHNNLFLASLLLNQDIYFTSYSSIKDLKMLFNL